jgi:hypothetical protein
MIFNPPFAAACVNNQDAGKWRRSHIKGNSPERTPRQGGISRGVQELGSAPMGLGRGGLRRLAPRPAIQRLRLPRCRRPTRSLHRVPSGAAD